MQSLTATVVLSFALQAGPVADSAGSAAALVRNAADALGGQERLLALERLEYGFAGAARFPYQGPAPDTPGRFEYAETTAMDFAGRAMRVESGFTGGETAFMQSRVYDAAGAGDWPAMSRQLRQSPHALIRTWLEAPRDLVLVAETVSGWVVAGPLYGSTVHASIDRKSLLVERVEVPFNDVRFGDAVASIEFNDYAEREGWRVPSRLLVVEAGTTVFDLPYASYRFDGPAVAREPAPAESSADDADAGRAEPPAMPSPDTFMHRDLGDGVRVLFNTGGHDYHSLAVVTDDGVVVVETPGSVADGERLTGRAAELGEVTMVAATHHHGDHAGAMPGAARAARELVVADAHRAFFRDAVTATRRLLPAAFEPPEDPVFVTVAAGGKRLLGDRVMAYDAGPTGHSDAQLVFYVPDARVLFQSDMAVFRWDGSVEAARTQTCRLQAFIEKRGLAVEHIVGGHGRPGTPDDLAEAIALREEPCP